MGNSYTFFSFFIFLPFLTSFDVRSTSCVPINKGNYGQALKNKYGNLPTSTLSNNYLFTYTTTTPQQLTTNFINIAFDFNGPIDGWDHTAGSATITCNKTALYFISFRGHYLQNGAQDIDVITVHFILNEVEIVGSQSTVNVPNNATPIISVSNCLVNITKGDILMVQHLRTGVAGTIALQGTGSGTTPIGGALTIRRVT